MPGFRSSLFPLIRCLLIVVVGLTALSSHALSQTTMSMETNAHRGSGDSPFQKFNRDTALDHSQDAIGNRLGSYHFRNQDGERVALSDFYGRPVAINMIYTSCGHTCPLIVESLGRAVEVADRSLGEENLTVLTIGFDVKTDTPRQMKAYKAAHGVDRKDWHFLSADAGTIEAFSRDLGFLFAPSPHGFDHLAQVTLLDRSGKVYYQVYGQTIPTPNFVEPLKQLVFGRAASLTSLQGIANQIQLFCTVYNPNTGRYQFDYSVIWTLIIGGLCLSGVAAFLFVEFRKTGAGV